MNICGLVFAQNSGQTVHCELATGAALCSVLTHAEVTGIPTAGDVRRLPLLLEAECQAALLTVAEAEAVLAESPGYVRRSSACRSDGLTTRSGAVTRRAE